MKKLFIILICLFPVFMFAQNTVLEPGGKITNRIGGSGASNFIPIFSDALNVYHSGNLFFTGGKLLEVGDYSLTGGANIRGILNQNAGAQSITTDQTVNYLNLNSTSTTSSNNININQINSATVVTNDGTPNNNYIAGVRANVSTGSNITRAVALYGGGFSVTSTSPNVGQVYGMNGRIDQNSASGNVGVNAGMRFDLRKNSNDTRHSTQGVLIDINDFTALGRWSSATGLALGVTNAENNYGINVSVGNNKGTGSTQRGLIVSSNVDGSGVQASSIGVEINASTTNSGLLTDYKALVIGEKPTNATTMYGIYQDNDMRNYLNGFVGIRNNNASSALDVNGNVEFNGDLRPNNQPGTAGQVLTSAGSGNVPTWTSPFITSISGTYSPTANASGLSVTAGVGILHQVTFTSPGILANGNNNLGGSITARVDDDYGFIVDQIGTAGYGYAFKVSNVLKAEIIAMPNGSNSDVDFTAQRSGGGVDSWLKYNGATNTTTFMDGTNGKLKLANILVQPYGSLTTTGVFTLSNSVVYVNLASNGTITIPTTYPDGSVLELFNESTTGVVVTVTADTGETLSSSLSFSTNGEFRRLRKKGTVWKLF